MVYSVNQKYLFPAAWVKMYGANCIMINKDDNNNDNMSDSQFCHWKNWSKHSIMYHQWFQNGQQWSNKSLLSCSTNQLHLFWNKFYFRTNKWPTKKIQGKGKWKKQGGAKWKRKVKGVMAILNQQTIKVLPSPLKKVHTSQRPKWPELILVSSAWRMHRSIATPPWTWC